MDLETHSFARQTKLTNPQILHRSLISTNFCKTNQKSAKRNWINPYYHKINFVIVYHMKLHIIFSRNQ